MIQDYLNIDQRSRDSMASDADRGLYEKFHVYRTDGRSCIGQKHHGCEYFVLDLTHDPFANAALEAYAKACRIKFPKLADDIEAGILKRTKQPLPDHRGEAG